MRRLVVVAAVAMLFVVGICLAGQLHSFKCHKCELQRQVTIGGGFVFEAMSCFCTTSNHFVSVTWKRGAPAPEPAARDKGVANYVCPECKKATARQWDQKTCPKCGSKEIEIKGIGPIFD